MDFDFLKLNKFASEYFNKGKCKEALQILEIACTDCKNTLGNKDPTYAILLNNYGYFLSKCNPSSLAINYMETAIKILEEGNHFDLEDYPIFLNNLAIVYRSIGKKTKAISLYDNALKLVNEDKFPLTYGGILLNISIILLEESQFSQALANLLKAKSFFDKQNKKKQHEYVAILSAIGLCYCGMKKFDKADLYSDLAISLCIELGFNYYHILNNFALNLFLQGRFDEAEEILEGLLEQMKLSHGENYFYTHNIYDNLTGIYIKQKRYDDAVETIIASSKCIEQYLSKFAIFLSDSDIIEPVSAFRHNIDVLISLFIIWDTPSKNSLEIAYSMISRRKGFFLEFEINRQKLLLSEKIDGKNTEFTHLKELTSELSHLNIIKLQDSFTSISNIEASIKKLENEINQIISKFSYPPIDSLYNDNAIEESKRIFEKIPPDITLVDYIVYNRIDFNRMAVADSRYFQFVITKDNGIQIMDLGSVNEINFLIQNYIEQITDFEQIYESKFDTDTVDVLSNKILSGLWQFLDKKNKLIIIPDGFFNLLPFGILRKDDEFLINNYEITYLTTSHDILNNSTIYTNNQTNSITIADPDYMVDNKDFGIINSEINPPFNKCIPLPIERLEETAKEGKAINEIIGGELWLRDYATKFRLLNVNSPKYLHIATHGFFCSKILKKSRKINPLLTSGLLLTGVEQYLKTTKLTKDYGNGIVTAYEASLMNLVSTELVVLSACDTGIGGIVNTEGVFGLRRAFSIAGAKTLIMSLWSVDDEATKELMISFYSHLNQGLKVTEALRQAQCLIQERYPHPYYWGAFILQGGLTTLDETNQ